MTIISFKRPDKQPPDDDGELAFSVCIYKNQETRKTTTIVTQTDREDGTVDLEQFLDELHQIDWVTHENLFEATADQNHELLFAMRVYRSSLVASATSAEDAFETKAQQRWLMNRMKDAYWQVAEPRGIGYALHTFSNWLSRMRARLRGEHNYDTRDDHPQRLS